ncbi:MAG: MoaD/ThiS family protein [Actinomycetota bacterium]|nr:MoaD/ThiS family protein [Actinomycetota bacterium]
MGVAVRVRMFAALREAAGTGEAEIDSGPLPGVLAALCSAYGEPFATRLTICTVLLDGSVVRPNEAVMVADGAELALLPPVSGGAGGEAARLALTPPVSGGAGAE